MDRIPSDHPSVDTLRVTLGRHGGSRVRVEVPPEDADRLPADGVLRLALDGTRRHARLDTHLTDERRLITGVYDTARLANDPSADGATERLNDWAADRGLDPGDPVLLDVVAADFLYGLRAPGERALYDDPDPPDSSLADIARDVEED